MSRSVAGLRACWVRPGSSPFPALKCVCALVGVWRLEVLRVRRSRAGLQVCWAGSAPVACASVPSPRVFPRSSCIPGPKACRWASGSCKCRTSRGFALCLCFGTKPAGWATALRRSLCQGLGPRILMQWVAGMLTSEKEMMTKKIIVFTSIK